MIDINEGHIEKLKKFGSWPESVHQFDKRSIWAIKAALEAERPLLIRGEPGCGKSQLARAAASVLNRAFISEVVHARSQCTDLQWHFDAVARLAEAQTLGTSATQREIKARMDARRFLSPGALWWAFNWQGAESQFELSNRVIRPPEKPDKWTPQQGCVLLIDEIDKADVDLPNGLLETLGNGAFAVPYLDESVGLKEGMPAPLVVITTNEERELPGAFLRRCMVLQLGLYRDETKLKNWLMERGEIHFGAACSRKVRGRVAEMLVKDRRDVLKLGLQPPGQAEYLDILRALKGIAGNEQKQLLALKEISRFALLKHPSEYDQDREQEEAQEKE